MGDDVGDSKGNIYCAETACIIKRIYGGYEAPI